MSNTKELPIVLTVDEVKAVIAGGKTQYRMPVKTPYGMPEFMGSRDCNQSDPSLWGWDGFEDGDTRLLSDEVCPLGAIGDRLWVQEFHARTDRNMHLTAPHYYADGPLTLDDRHDAGLLTKYSAADMPRWASRLTLEITDIRIERVQDITGTGVFAEGCNRKDMSFHSINSSGCTHANAFEWFKDHWFERYTAASWVRNDWVWVIEFKVIKETSNG